MLKKLFVLAGGTALLVSLYFGRDTVSYARTVMSKMRSTVRESVPVDFEIERARKMITDLVPEIRQNMHLIAKEEVEVERLAEQVARLDRSQQKDRVDLMRLKSDADSGQENFYYAGRRYSKEAVKVDLTNRFERFKTNDATLVNLTKVLSAREKSLAAARQKLEGMLSAKRQLEVDVENLEARQKMVEVAQTTSDFNFDSSHLARTKELIRDIQTRIEVSEKLLDADFHFHDEIPLDEPVAEDISERITEYFNASPESLAEAVGGNGAAH